MPEDYAEVACENCGTVLLMRYEQLSAPSGDKPSIGCPECQATTSVVAKWHDMQRAAAPEFIHLTALEKKTEIGLASERTMPARTTAQHHAEEDDPMTPSSKATEARKRRRADKERAEDEAEQRQEDNRHEQDAVNDIEEDAQDARQDDEDAAADRGDS